MPYVFNPFTGKLDFVNDITGSTTFTVDRFTLNGTDITNKFVTLSGTPSPSNNVNLSILYGSDQEYGVDFTVSGNQLSWNGLALDGFLASGDKLIVVYG